MTDARIPGVDLYGIRRGIDLINRQEYFEAHEVLEDVWRAAPSDDKKFMQGLVQVAVAFHHYTQGNATGAQSVLRRARKNLSEPAPAVFAEFDIAALLDSLLEWQEAMHGNGSAPALPRIEAARK